MKIHNLRHVALRGRGGGAVGGGGDGLDALHGPLQDNRETREGDDHPDCGRLKKVVEFNYAT